MLAPAFAVECPCDVEPLCVDVAWVVGFGACAPCGVVGFGEPPPRCAAMGTTIININIAAARMVLFMPAHDRKRHTCAARARN